MKKEWLNKNITKHITDALSYSGSRGKDKVISASGLGSDTLKLFLKAKYGLDESNGEFMQSHLGTLVHNALETIFTDKNGYKAEKRLMLQNYYRDWSLSGEPDLVIEKKVLGENIRVIVDWKTYKLNKLELIKDPESKEHRELAIQLGVYALLTDKKSKRYNSKVETYVAVFVKDATRFGYEPSEDLVYVKINHLPEDEIYELFKNKVDELEEYLSKNENPPECEFLGWSARQRGAKKEKLICKHFCGVASNCPYYYGKSRRRKLDEVKKFLGRI